jgi:hypothetical protein
VHHWVEPITSHGKLHEFGAEKPISLAKQAYFDFFARSFTIWSHILVEMLLDHYLSCEGTSNR